MIAILKGFSPDWSVSVFEDDDDDGVEDDRYRVFFVAPFRMGVQGPQQLLNLGEYNWNA